MFQAHYQQQSYPQQAYHDVQRRGSQGSYDSDSTRTSSKPSRWGSTRSKKKVRRHAPRKRWMWLALVAISFLFVAGAGGAVLSGILFSGIDDTGVLLQWFAQALVMFGSFLSLIYIPFHIRGARLGLQLRIGDKVLVYQHRIRAWAFVTLWAALGMWTVAIPVGAMVLKKLADRDEYAKGLILKLDMVFCALGFASTFTLCLIPSTAGATPFDLAWVKEMKPDSGKGSGMRGAGVIPKSFYAGSVAGSVLSGLALNGSTATSKSRRHDEDTLHMRPPRSPPPPPPIQMQMPAPSHLHLSRSSFGMGQSPILRKPVGEHPPYSHERPLSPIEEGGGFTRSASRVRSNRSGSSGSSGSNGSYWSGSEEEDRCSEDSYGKGTTHTATIPGEYPRE
ncbi:hypothetical protein B0H66DRAFT_616894 [Apodospora peruviana]|uniref:Uncharacterized protein n=1 Tax=Apodospora peruviana TaxID=516989 RepID=A0AAE0IKK7_9PEZI|nr:hypothetical protein B0H66DRAFT_616894 [Apodospora peruviana]